MNSSISLFVPRVHCADETTGSFRERFGNDEIYLGAVYVGISADKSFDVRVVQTRSVGDNFDDNETVNWNWELFTYELGDPAVHPFPKAVLTSLVLAEHDWGDGRNDFVESVAEEFRKKLTEKAIDSVVTAALTAMAVGDDGDSKTPKNPDVDTKTVVVDALTEWAKEQIKNILNEAVAQAKAWAGDEIFPPVLKLLKIDSATHTWNGSGDTPEEIAEFTGHDGKYQASMFWQLRSIDEPAQPLPTGPVAQGDDMQPGEVLNPGQSISSPTGQYSFVYQGDGNLVLYRGGTPWWASGTDGTAPGVCIMQTDGNLVIYAPGSQPIWSSDTSHDPGSRLVVQDDGNVVIYRPDRTPVWATNTSVPTGPVAQGDDVQPGEVLNPGGSISSANGQYLFTYQTDGNLVLYRGGAPLWASGTDGTATGVCIMQDDGNLVIYALGDHYVWDSATQNNPGSRLVVQDDGNVVIYRPDGTPIWATNTHAL
jgi:hypothetical protein